MSWILGALVAGAIVYCVLVIRAARVYAAVNPVARRGAAAPVSVLKPLAGAEPQLSENLESYFAQDYPGAMEILLAVRNEDDPAVPIVQEVMARHAGVSSRLLITGEPPYANAKVWSLQRMTEAARHDVLVMSDSDVRVGPDFLAAVMNEFADPFVAVSTCPYRAVGGPSFWSRLEAAGMNTEFLGGVLVARMLEGMRFALGPTITARRSVLERIGGWDYLKDFLAEDFVLGHRAAELGAGVILSRYVIEHRIGSEPWKTNFAHRLRWNRSTRRSRPAGYIGQLFTNPTPLALAGWAAAPEWWPLWTAALALRYAAGFVTGVGVVRDAEARNYLWLLPVQDLLSFAFWAAGFFGNTILWRGRRYFLRPDGRFELVQR